MSSYEDVVKLLKQKRERYKLALRRLQSNIQVKPEDDEFKLQVRLERLNENYEQFSVIQTQIEEIDYSELRSNERDCFDELYVDLSAKLRRWIAELQFEKDNVVITIPTQDTQVYLEPSTPRSTSSKTTPQRSLNVASPNEKTTKHTTVTQHNLNQSSAMQLKENQSSATQLKENQLPAEHSTHSTPHRMSNEASSNEKRPNKTMITQHTHSASQLNQNRNVHSGSQPNANEASTSKQGSNRTSLTQSNFNQISTPQQPIQYIQTQRPNQYIQTQQSNQYMSTQQPNQYMSTQQPNQYIQTQQSNQYIQTQQHDQYMSTQQPNQFTSTQQPNQYIQTQQPNQYIQTQQPNQFMSTQQYSLPQHNSYTIPQYNIHHSSNIAQDNSALHDLQLNISQINHQDYNTPPYDGNIAQFNQDYTVPGHQYNLFKNQHINQGNPMLYSSNLFASQLKLPPLNLPTFNNQTSDWLSFKHTFQSLINSNNTLTDAHKLYHLRNQLNGTALDLIQNLNITEENYAVAWSILEKRFENVRLTIYSHMTSIFNIQKMTRENASELRNIIDTVTKHCKALEVIGQPVRHWDVPLQFILSTKLDKITMSLWEGKLKSTDLPTLEDMLEFLEQRYCALSFLNTNDSQRQTNYPTNNKRYERYQNKSYAHYSHNTEDKPQEQSMSHAASYSNDTCLCCKNKKYHPLFRCIKFLSMTTEGRWNYIKTNKLCENCMKLHSGSQCASSACRKCGLNHNTLLCKGVPEDTTSNVSAFCSNDHHVLLSTVKVYIRDSKGSEHSCRALLDLGSQPNFISDSLVKKLQLPIKKIQCNISGIGKSKSTSNSMVSPTIRSYINNTTYEFDYIVLPEITDVLPAQRINISTWSIPPGIQLADPDFNKPGTIDLIIGAGKLLQTFGNGKIQLYPNNPNDELPLLQQTDFGWILSGSYPRMQNNNFKDTSCIASAFHSISNSELDLQLSKFWEVENFKPNKKILSSEETFCEAHFSDNVSRDQTGKFVVKLPVTEGRRHALGDSSSSALKRFYSLERRLTQNSSLKSRYIEFMREYEQLGHMECVTDDVGADTSYYLPHHAVQNPLSLTTKTRVVFDGSAPSSNGVSLNDILSVGPQVQPELFTILIKFRTNRYAITADVHKMFRMIWLNSADQDLQRIYWRESPSDRLQIFRLKTVTYGTKSASYLATKCLNQTTIEEGQNYPTGAAAIKEDFYVDDFLSGSNDLNQLINLYNEVNIILKSCGFELKKWCSNCPQMYDIFNDSGSEDEHFMINVNGEEGIRTLGLWWHPISDTFRFRSPEWNSCGKTKRQVTSDLAKIFDPLGLLGPIIVKAKMFVQSIWKIQINWDEELPSELQNSWSRFKDSLGNLKNLTVDRYFWNMTAESVIELHGFSDASMLAYGACVYIRIINNEKIDTVALVASRSRVAPLKTITLPRLELCGAVLLTQLMSKVSDSIKNYHTCFFYTDSSVVLSWIRACPSRWTTFVSNRVSAIQETSNPSQWSHVKTSENPADLISRGATTNELIEDKLWWYGPPWLLTAFNYIDEFPNNIDLEDIPEQRTPRQVTALISIEISDLFDKISSYKKIVNVIAYVRRFIHNTRTRKNERSSGALTPGEICSSVNSCILLAQHSCFAEEITSLRKGKQVSSNSTLVALNPFLDKQGLLRVGGRLSNSPLSYQQKHPIILPHQHKFTKLLASYLHKIYLHPGQQTLLYLMRLNYWPIRGKDLCRFVSRECLACFKVRPTPASYLMGDLPSSRVTPARPFANTGTDYCGPFYIRQSDRRNAPTRKAWICLFICMATRAIHIELVTDMTASAFIAALRRFMSRRGACTNIFCDNGSNYIGANNALKELRLLSSKDWQKEISQEFSMEGIRFHFSVPNSPHMAGCWEAGIKLIKQHLKRSIGTSQLTFEGMTTILCQIEACLNSRPLSAMSDDPNDLTPITPADFLVGSSLMLPPEMDLTEERLNSLDRWQRYQQIYQQFWQRWSREYISDKQRRNKWRNHTTPLELETLVLIQEDNLPPLKWRLGRVIDLTYGNDQIPRVATMKTQAGILKRAVTRLCPLPPSKQPVG